MQDTTVSGIRFASDSGVKAEAQIFQPAVPHSDEDELLARVLITSWSLATGRTLRRRAAADPDRGRADQLLGRRQDRGAAEREPDASCPVLTAPGRLAAGAVYLQEHRHGLAVEAAGDYPADRKVAGTPLLAAPGWQPAEPVPLRDIGLELVPVRRGRPTALGRPRCPRRPGAAAARTAGRDPLPALLRRGAGPGRPGGVRESPHLPADRGRAGAPRERPGWRSPAATTSTASTPARRPRTSTPRPGSAAARPACAP